ncbi:MAG: DUF6494 family protein [Wenzhouxiangellaceae bacterium]|nr:DUF6494 family protein [Wenzhouxiangellaceae bacterium]
MDEERLNLSVRKFLKQVGVTSQREIEQAVRAADADGSLPGGPLKLSVRLECPDLDLSHTVDGELDVG